MTSTHSTASHPTYRADIDGLRAISILSVVGFHAFPKWLPGGFIGVDVFFVISGYLISQIIFGNLNRGTFSFKEFYSRRIKRIFPALILVLAASYVFGWFDLLADEYKQLGKHVAGGAGFASNLVLMNEAGYFDNSTETKPLAHLWSLGVEEQFYLIWPALVWLAWRSAFSLLALTVVVAAASFYLNLRGINSDPIVAFYSLQTRFWQLLCGSVLAWLVLRNNAEWSRLVPASPDGGTAPADHAQPKADNGILANGLSLVGLSLLLYGFWRINGQLGFPGLWAVIPVLAAALIICAGPRAWINRVVLSNRAIVWIGLISFPLYLWHWPLLSFARIVESEVPAESIRMTAVALSVFLAFVTYELVERPVRFGRRSRPTVAVLSVLMLVVGAAGYAAYSQDGFRFRLRTLDRNIEQLTYEFPATRNCRAAEVHQGVECYRSATRYPKSIYLIGDSHAGVALHGFKQLFDRGDLGFNVRSVGKPGCFPFLNTETTLFDGRSLGCRGLINDAIDEAVGSPDVEWVLLVARLALRFSGLPFGAAEKRYLEELWSQSYESGAKKSTNAPEIFELGFGETVERIRRAGKKILFVHQMPELGYEPRQCLRRSRITGSARCSLDRAAVEARLNPYKEAVRRLGGAHPAFAEYDPIDHVCGEETCTPFKDGRLMYWDNNHMSKIASEIIAEQIAKTVLGVPVADVRKLSRVEANRALKP